MQLDPEKVLTMDIEQLHETLQVLVIDYPELKDVLKKYIQGIKIKFDIRYIINEQYREKAKSNEIIIIPHSQFLNLLNFYDELDARKALARHAILEITEKDNPIGESKD